jgi:hypothetical protein
MARIRSRKAPGVAEELAAAPLTRLEGGERYDVVFCDLVMPVMDGSLRALIERRVGVYAEAARHPDIESPMCGIRRYGGITVPISRRLGRAVCFSTRSGPLSLGHHEP